MTNFTARQLVATILRGLGENANRFTRAHGMAKNAKLAGSRRVTRAQPTPKSMRPKTSGNQKGN